MRLDHADARLQDEAVGVPGAHARALAGLAALAAERTRPSQQVNVKVRLNARRSGRPPGLAEAGGATHGATVSVEPGFPLPASALRRARAGRRGFAGCEGRLLEPAAPAAISCARMDEALPGGVGGCQAGRAFFNVDHRGRVSKCVEFRGPEDRVGRLGGDAAIAAVLPRLRERPGHEPLPARAGMRRGAKSKGSTRSAGLIGRLPDLVRG